ncbi:Protein fam49a [Coelomomyces lativittatus]|nr:Protein fam49a [Coelomomyces lativittatus]
MCTMDAPSPPPLFFFLEKKKLKSISKPSPENDDHAWNAVLPCVTTLKSFFDFACKFEILIPEILNFFCEPSQNMIDVRANMEKYQGSARAFAEYVSFCCQFDELKMSIPSIQNDFSFYRRVLSRTKTPLSQPLPVTDELANRMSLFYAYSTPMLKSLIDQVTMYVSKHQLQLPIATCLMMLTGAFHDTMHRLDPAWVPFALRVMTVCLVLFDHIHPHGLFSKQSDVNLRLYVKDIQTHGGTSATTLINILKFSTPLMGHG